MNKLQLTKGELTKIILEEVRSLQEQDLQTDAAKAAVKAAAEEVADAMKRDPKKALELAALLKEMDKYE